METQYYLLDQKKYSELYDTLVKISKLNGTFDREEVLVNFKTVENMIKIEKINDTKDILISNDVKPNLSQIFSSILGPYIKTFNSYANILIIMKLFFMFITMYFIYFGQLLNVEKLNGNLYFNNLIIYFGELIADISASWFLSKLKRKQLIFMCFSLCTICSVFVHVLEISDLFYLLKTTFVFANSLFISILFMAVFIYSSEVLDPNVKNTIISILTNVSTIFLLFSPQIIELFSTPFILFSVISFISALNSLIIKEVIRK